MMTESRLCLTEDVSSSTRVVAHPSWWKKRSRLERRLCLSLLFAVGVSIGIGACFVWMYLTYKGAIPDLSKIDLSKYMSMMPPLPTPPVAPPSASPSPTAELPSERKPNVCATPGCVKAASSLLRNMDPSADPCHDFYQFACGGFEARRYIDDDKSKTGQFSHLNNVLNNQIKEIIEEEVLDNDTRSMKIVKDFYASCMNQSKILSIGLAPLRDLIVRLGGWPVVDGDGWTGERRNDFSWQNLTYRFKENSLGYNLFIELSVGRDFVTGDRHILHLDEPGLPIQDAYLKRGWNSSALMVSYEFMVEAAVFFGANRTRAEMEMKDVVDFMIALDELMDTEMHYNNLTEIYVIKTIDHLYEINPSVNWLEYVERLFPGHDVNGSEPVVVIAENYTRHFTELLANTKPRVLANYAVSETVFDLAPMVSEAFANMRFDKLKKLHGAHQRSARWRRCLSETKAYFSEPLGQLYVRKFFRPEAKEKVTEMVAYITDELDRTLDRVSWLDEKTREKAKDKLKAVQSHIAYPDELLNDTAVDQIYENITISRDEYFLNFRRYQKRMHEKYEAKLRKPVTKNDWKRASNVAVVNAFYSGLDNSITLPAGILQGVFFNVDRPEYMNFASIGAVVGHELTHGFDNKGKQFDKDGHLDNWWEEETDRRFRERAECLEEQYGNYTAPASGKRLDGQQTLGENIADNGGVKQTFRAYKRWRETNGEEPGLPGLNMTTRQLFWLSYANVWCGKQRLEAEVAAIQFNVHSVHRFRVNGPLANLAHFSEDFQCPGGSEMNPNRKCSVW